ncbi:Male accessory gland serine protease inhibitor [Halotydeus destructor]|nr:Male accessory gland serine protease inhibitor [Halotydeus destructor]
MKVAIVLCALLAVALAGPVKKPSTCLEKPFVDGDGKGMVCYAYMKRWSYVVEDNECRDFVFGGCGGNTNHFMTKEECEAECVNK